MTLDEQIALCGSNFWFKVIPDDLPEEEYCRYLTQKSAPYEHRKFCDEKLTELEEKERMNILMRSRLAYYIYKEKSKDEWNWHHFAYRNMIRSGADLEALVLVRRASFDNMFRE